MKVLLIGANGYMGPHVVRALAPHHHLRITDITPPPDEIKRESNKQPAPFMICCVPRRTGACVGWFT